MGELLIGLVPDLRESGDLGKMMGYFDLVLGGRIHWKRRSTVVVNGT